MRIEELFDNSIDRGSNIRGCVEWKPLGVGGRGVNASVFDSFS